MDSGLYAACAGLSAKTQALDVVANNLANLNTTGYRGHQMTFQSLIAGGDGLLQNPLNRVINDFGVLGGSRVDLAPANLERTGNALDLAIEGNGFFMVQAKRGTLYTRDGNFRISAQGQLTTAQGDPVLGEQGPVVVPSGTVSVSADGTLSVDGAGGFELRGSPFDGAIAGKLRLVEFAPGADLRAEGNSYYAAEATPRTAAEVSLRQGMLEASNVNPIFAMTGLIAVQRQAEMLARALSTFSNDFDRIAATDLPRV